MNEPTRNESVESKTSTVLIETHMNHFVPVGIVVNDRVSLTLFAGSGSPDSIEGAMKDPRVKSVTFAQLIRGTRTNYGCPPGAKKAEVKAAKALQRPNSKQDRPPELELNHFGAWVATSWSRAAVAKHLGISVQHVSRLMTGQDKPSLRLARKIETMTQTVIPIASWEPEKND